MSQKSILNEIVEERKYQDNKFGKQVHPCLDQTLLNREGSCTSDRMCQHFEIPTEARAKFLCDNSFKAGQGTYAHIAIEELSEAVSQFDIYTRRAEVIQLAAVCVAWVESIDHQIEKLETKKL